MLPLEASGDCVVEDEADRIRSIALFVKKMSPGMQVRPQRYRTLHEVTDLFTKSHRLIHKDMNPSTGDRIVHKDTDSSTEI